MEAPGSTTLVVVGEESATAITALDGLANVESATFLDATDAEIAKWSATSAAPYVVHDRDPLGHVASAWVEFFDDRATLETLQLEIALTVRAAARHEISVPDYYVVLRPETMPTTWMHWWLGVLAQASPTRVIPWPDADVPIAELLRKLPTGRAWPDVERWLPRVVTSIPDRVGLPGAV